MRKKKNAFILLIVLTLLITFSYLSIDILYTRTYSKYINTLKYLELQAQIHMKYVKQNVLKNTNINDERFSLNIIFEKNTSTHHIYLFTKDNSHISLYDKVVQQK